MLHVSFHGLLPPSAVSKNCVYDQDVTTKAEDDGGKSRMS